MQHNVYYCTLAEEENVVLRQAEKSFLGEIGHNLLMGQRAGHDVERDRNLPHHGLLHLKIREYRVVITKRSLTWSGCSLQTRY